MITIDQRIIRLVELLKYQKVIKYNRDFYDEIGILRQNFLKVKNGDAHFTVSQINTICKKYKVNANWLFGIEPKVFMSPNSIEIIDFPQ